ncbi:Pregnancy-associated plasma protein-A [compost metagenome]
MKKRFYSLLGISLLSTTWSFAQQRILDKENMREGEHVEYCVTHKKLAELKKDPSKAAMIEAARLEAENQSKIKGGNNTPKATLYKVPVVFHILHNNGPENISREQILDAMAILNRDFRKLNADANNVQAPFQGMPADVEIEFELATRAPNGTCFAGITRTVTALTNGDDGQDQLNAVITGNDVFQGVWPHTQYLNVFVAADIGGAAGYTFNPWTGANTNASNMFYNSIFMLHTYTGSIGTANSGSSRALTHEVGHWLNLSHTWGGNNNPGDPESCGEDDGVQDTPLCIGVTNCNNVGGINTCNDLDDPEGNSSWTTDVIDNIENYMDYSYCSKMFTPGQVTRMRNSLLGNTSGRNQLITPDNHTATGINTIPTLCTAKFSTPRTIICAGEAITFTDESYNAVSGWTWTFAGGSPASATMQNPTVIYNTPGTYAVKLVATDGSSNSTSDISAYITVLPAGGNLPFYESFEGTTNLTDPTWSVYNGGGNAWTVTNTAGNSGTNSAKLTNFGQATGQIDELISGPVDLSGITAANGGVTLSFRYAYRRRSSSNNDILRVLLTSNCGETWEVRRTFTAPTMSGTATATSAWTPTQADWVTVHVTNVTSAFWNENFRYKFQFTSGGGNNMYLDDINLYAGSPSEEPVTAGLEDLGTVANINLFPNPAENEIQVSFNSKTTGEIVFYVTDLTGKQLAKHAVNAAEGNNLVYIATDNLSSGTYLIRMTDGSTQRTLTFVKK